MLDCESAREHLLRLEDEVIDVSSMKAYLLCVENLKSFIADVDHLLKHNSIKQVPALFKK